MINPPDNTIKHFTSKITKWAENNFAEYPWRKTNNNWHALVAEIMLQRTAADQVVPVYNNFCNLYETPSDYYLNADGTLFDSLGLKWRAVKLYELSAVLSDNNIPEEKEKLLKLPGVGDYIASAYRSMHLGHYDVIVDSNIVRLYGRYYGFDTDGETRRKKDLKELANKITPLDSFQHYNYGIIDFTRVICRPKPLCSECPLLSNKESRFRCFYSNSLKILNK